LPLYAGTRNVSNTLIDIYMFNKLIYFCVRIRGKYKRMSYRYYAVNVLMMNLTSFKQRRADATMHFFFIKGRLGEAG
jgi:hypothetical protein